MTSAPPRSRAQRAMDYHNDRMRLRATLAPMQAFRDVLATRAPDRDTPSVEWPDFEHQVQARLWRNNRAVCKRPEITGDPRQTIADPAVFVSMYDNHFGHFVSETVPRLPQSLAEAPELKLYFTSDRVTDVAQTSGMFKSVLDWLNIPIEQVRMINQPTAFRDLLVAGQAEHLNSSHVADGYLPLLEARYEGAFRATRPEGITYVSRALLAPQKGISAAERYLVACLSALGVRIVYPELLPLRQQMEIYAQSRHLVFAEGSAAHGRQLLGRVDQDISILRRRFRSHLAKAQLEARCTALTYVSSYGGALFVRGPDGRKIHHAMQSLYAVEPVLEHFESLGVPLRRLWTPAVYRRLRDEDVLAWVSALYALGAEPWLKPHNTDAELLDQFEPLGLGHLRREAAALMRRHR